MSMKTKLHSQNNRPIMSTCSRLTLLSQNNLYKVKVTLALNMCGHDSIWEQITFELTLTTSCQQQYRTTVSIYCVDSDFGYPITYRSLPIDRQIYLCIMEHIKMCICVYTPQIYCIICLAATFLAVRHYGNDPLSCDQHGNFCRKKYTHTLNTVLVLVISDQ